MKTCKIFSLLSLSLLAGMMMSCNSDAVDEGDYSYLRQGLVSETQSDGSVMYFVPVEGTSNQMAVTWDRSSEFTLEKIYQLYGGSAGTAADYFVNNGTGESGLSTYIGAVTVPEKTQDGKVVTSIGTKSYPTWAFTGNSNLESVTLPSSITSIEAMSVAFCGKLKYFGPMDNVTFIGDGAFAKDSLASVTIPAGVDTIHRYAFAYNSNMRELTFRPYSKLKAIEAGAFTQDELNKVGSRITSISFPDGLEYIGNYAFTYNNYLRSIDLVNTSVKEIGMCAFKSCSSATSLTLPTTLQKLGESCFNNCTGLTRVDLSNTQLTEIPATAFASCRVLKDIILPNTIKSLGQDCFKGVPCTSYYKYLPEELQPEVFEDSLLLYTNKYSPVVESIYVPASVKRIGTYFCFNQTTNKEVSFQSGSNLTEIGTFAFRKNIFPTFIFPSKLKRIGKSAFEGCTELTSANLSDTQVTEISDSLFKDCSSLTTVKLPNTITYVGGGAFQNCGRLTTLDLSNTQITKLQDNCCNLSPTQVTTTIKLPVSCTELGSNALPTGTSAAIVYINCSTKIKCPEGAKYTKIILHVPNSLEASYKSDNTWAQCIINP